jgi:hypothetical protein
MSVIATGYRSARVDTPALPSPLVESHGENKAFPADIESPDSLLLQQPQKVPPGITSHLRSLVER